MPPTGWASDGETCLLQGELSVAESNAWVDIRGEWLFEGCVNLENDDSHGNELFVFTDTTVTLKIDRYNQPDCQGTYSQQVMTLDSQRLLDETGPVNSMENLQKDELLCVAGPFWSVCIT